MVGVGGKSRACKECKRRRVKCGQEWPSCLRCDKRHLVCSGYDQEVFFINRTLADPTVSAPTVLARCQAKRTKLSSIQDELETLIRLLDSPVALTASPSALRLGALDLLQRLYLPQPEVAVNELNSSNPFSWVKAVCELEDICPVLDHAIVAFCAAQVYVTETGDVSQGQSIDLYHNALQRLSSVLTIDGDDRLDFLLASIVVLSSCEMFICTTDHSWTVHINGIADVLRLRKDAPRMPHRTWISLCSRLRVVCILSQLTRREKGPLSREQWAKLIPESSNTELFGKLMDIACELPGTLEEAAGFLTASEIYGLPNDKSTGVVVEMWRVLKQIYDCQASLHATSPKPLYTAVASRFTNPADKKYDTKLFPFALTFRSLSTLSYFVVSWAMQLQILTTLLQLEQDGVVPDIVPLQVRDLHESFGGVREEAEKIARYLCQSVEYCHRNEMGTAGPQTMLYSKWIMRYFFTRFGTEREVEWCQNIQGMNGTGSRCGIKMMAFQG